MKTEITPKIKSGFFLNETEFARIKDAINDQFKKLAGGHDADFTYEVKYINGGITEPSAISSITSEENDGSKRVIRVVIVATSSHRADARVEVRLSDLSYEENADDAPISYAVTSNDQDWTFVTSSTIEERVNKIKTSKLMQTMTNPKVYRVAPLIVVSGVMIYLMTTMSSLGSDRVAKIKYIRATSRSMWEYIYRVDTMRSADDSLLYFPVVLIPLMLLTLFMDFIMRPVTRWLPTYTFYWGDRVKFYDRKLWVLKFIFGSIILALALGVIGNFVYDRMMK